MANLLKSKAYTKHILHKNYVFLLCIIIFIAKPLAANQIDLPKLTESNLEISSIKENQLGEIWLQHLRSYVTLDTDAIIYDYVESLLYDLSSYSNLDLKSPKLIIVDDPSLNAFAVPGGIIGINTGLLNYAKSEAQLASVLCHEIAHLSQRHFFRRQEASKYSNLTLLAGMLSGVLLGMANETDAAQAAIFGAQAAAIENQLRYSRLHEKEADRIGMKILIDAGYSPQATIDIFKEMLDVKRFYGNDTPEFLLTHPITERRISEAKNRVRKETIFNDKYNTLDYSLIRVRNEVNKKPYEELITSYQIELNSILKNNFVLSHDLQIKQESILYGLALSYLKKNQWIKAKKITSKLLNRNPNKIIYKLLDVETDLIANEYAKAEEKLLNLHSLSPSNYPISMLLGKTLHYNKKFTEASNIFLKLAINKPSQINIWFHAAESQGLAGDIVGLHRSRAEFFFLKGNFKQSIIHLQQALSQSHDNFQLSSKIKKRISDIKKFELVSKKYR